MMLSGADILVRTLIEQGVDTVFGYPGGQILNVYDSLYKYQNEITHVLTAHEQGATHAADGYARTTGKVGVVISTSGPGATNLVTGIATAYLDSIPMVALCGNVPTTQIGTDSFQEIDITGVTLPITKHNYFVGSVDELADTIREAFRLAQSGRPGPVLIDVPKDVQTALCEYEAQPPVTADAPTAAKELRVEQAAALINAARRPFVYFGGGLVAAGAQSEMLALAEKLDAPIGCSLTGISGIPTDHPRFLGMQGMHGHYASSLAMHNADLIISLGVRFNDRVTGDRSRFAPGARIVQIDVDGFCDAIDRIGGIEVVVNQQEADEMNRVMGCTLSAGKNHMRGTLAVYYSRMRAIDSDFGRTGRQRQVVECIVDKLRSMNPLECVAAVNGIIEDINIVTNLSNSEILSLTAQLPQILNYEIETKFVPYRDTYTNRTLDNGAEVLDIDLEQNCTILREFLYPPQG